MKIYISGPMSGLPDLNRDAFFALEGRLLKQFPGCTIVNPARVFIKGADWLTFMRADLKLLLDCDTIAMLPDWQKSKGAMIEHNLALDLDYVALYGY